MKQYDTPMGVMREQHRLTRKQIARLLGKSLNTVDGYIQRNHPVKASLRASEDLTLILQDARDTADIRLSDIGAKTPNSVSLRVVALAIVAKHHSPDVPLTLSDDELRLFSILGE